MAEPMEEQSPLIALAHKRFLYRTQDVPVADRAQLQQDILDLVRAHDMAPLYEEVCSELGVAEDAAALSEMRERNTKQLAELQDKIKDAEVNAGDVEVRDALQARADYICSIGDHAAALEAYAAAEAKTAGVGPKMDLAFSQIRLELSRGDWRAVKAGLEKAQLLCDKGGDWERKNKLKVYEATFLMATRQFKRAAELLLDAIATFTTGDLMSYEQCIYYTVLLAVVALDRPTLKAKVIDSPEVLSVIDVLPHARPFLSCLHNCQYAEFFEAFAGLTDSVRADRYLHPHFRYFMREVRAVAYVQFLESYKSVTLASMAASFGVSPAFLDAELADFIVAGRLPAQIDKVAGVVETNRADAKTALYQQTIKQGDLLLNRLQKLSKVIDIE
ncbi:hypothetical protein D9Q98_005584 [Chlorella vulgaris]|uniref:26S proteasome regulatory subunit RPN7 n=1 Tax=Chlorella vulgaris TaxID=3077 RepID=A0A9D4TMY9_CHLVU|nr:hypothetical protein D9Q98_005584 [Chlorella vulgaris]